MIKTLKGKIIAGTMAVGLLSSAGVALGATDAGVQIKAWYDGQFGKASSNVDTTYSGYQKDKFEGFGQDYEGLKGYATKNIAEVTTTQISLKGKNIDNQKKEHIDAINKEKKTIEGYMDSQFKKISEDARVKINSAADQAGKDADEGMSIHVGAEGSIAREKVEKELGAAKEAAVSELKEAIEEAKSELQKQLDSKSTATIKELTDLIDTRINELSKNITKRTNELLARQYGVITNEAVKQEKAAKDEMADLVKSINK